MSKGYNDVFEVEILGDSVSHPLPVVDTSSIGVLHHPFKFCRAAKGHLVETGNVESSISLNIYSNPFSLQVWWMEKSVSRWKLHRQMTNTSSSVLKFEENLWRSGKCYLNYLIFGA